MEGEDKIIESVLSEEIGSSWTSFLDKCLIRSTVVFKDTHWAKEKRAESELAKRLSFGTATYLNLVEKLGKEKAFEIMRKILIPISISEQQQKLATLDLSDRRGMDRLMAFRESERKDGVGRFNQETFIKQSSDILHYQVTDCFYACFFQEAGTPELTKLLCESDREFYPKAFPDLEFHRGSSWENTIGCGKDHCEFIFEKKD